MLIKRISISVLTSSLALFCVTGTATSASARSPRILSVTGADAKYISYSRSLNVWKFSACGHTDGGRASYLQYKYGSDWRSAPGDKFYKYDPNVSCTPHFPNSWGFKVREPDRGVWNYRMGYPTDSGYGPARFFYFTVTVG